jgi:hypothetical protein
VFLHALLRPGRQLKDHEVQIKEGAKKILERVMDGEPVSTTVVHLSETANILESRVSIERTSQILTSIVSFPSLKVMSVDDQEYSAAIAFSAHGNLSINDALAIIKMEKGDMAEIYSFDKHLDGKGLIRLTD